MTDRNSPIPARSSLRRPPLFRSRSAMTNASIAQEKYMTAPTVVICCASAGVGRATARAFAQAGYAVALVARGERGLMETRVELERLRGRVLCIAADVADAEAIDQAAARGEAELGPIGVWVNAAMAT